MYTVYFVRCYERRGREQAVKSSDLNLKNGEQRKQEERAVLRDVEVVGENSKLIETKKLIQAMG